MLKHGKTWWIRIFQKFQSDKKYTNGGASNGSSASTHQYQGWSSNGMKWFNELFDIVEADRNSENALTYEESFRDFCLNGGTTGKKKKVVQPLFEEVIVRHELGGEEEDNLPCADELDKTSKNTLIKDSNDSDEEDPFGVTDKFIQC